MGYGRLGASEPGGGSEPIPNLQESATSASSLPPPQPRQHGNRKTLTIVLSLISIALIIASAVSAVLLIGLRSRASGLALQRRPTQAISRTCGKTRFPTLCVNSLLDFPGSLTASEKDLVHISFNMTLQHFSKALYLSSAISYVQMDPRIRSAYDDCLELLEDSVDALSSSLFSVAPGGQQMQGIVVGSNEDVLTWLSAALTNQDTCTDGFADVGGPVKDQIAEKTKDLSELVSNCLSIFSGSVGDDFSGVPIQNRRRRMLLSGDDVSDIPPESVETLPKWLGRKERELLNAPVPTIQADIIVSKDGNGTVKTIAEAIKKAPEKSSRRTIIYVKAGR